MNQMELSPNYAGTLRGFTSTFGNVTGFVAPLIAGAITTDNVSCIRESDVKKVVRGSVKFAICKLWVRVPLLS